ncbi:hypothetical protein DESUT3_07290 [Desulfuromonas versatilis]|uniref:Uncharacterized protein n=1 Tax=Desulfuromonas versatilis TaxID=2802975 RepID=A0ABN6DU85_9BACT|nr:hypothetical protein [Desulfuromonas versatilis]BCR03660.1 hypothetical protein DESUT3_07290 [Desulfuromonas versatilis]
MPKKEECPSPAEHKMHMCALKKNNMTDEMKKRSSNPKFVCGNCGAKANEASHVCKPQPM